MTPLQSAPTHTHTHTEHIQRHGFSVTITTLPALSGL
uniref:Uncharacterized protein n=1 Tax=Anguilla anguilla TaxID=7936 RepID=A0A0E9RET6_ANGAN